MTLGAPLAIWWLLIMLPVVGLFLFRRRRTVLEFPAIAIWEQFDRTLRVARLGRRFSRLATLLAQLLIIAMLIAALTDPNSERLDTHLVIVLDDSATMQTHEPSNKTRLDLAKRIARRRVRAQSSHVPISVILAGESPKLNTDHETDHALVDSRIADLAPRDVRARLDRSVRLAQAVTSAGKSGHVVVLTDKPRPSQLNDSDIEWEQVGTWQPDVAIASLGLSDERDAVIVVLAQRGFSDSPATVRLVSDGREVARKEITLRDAPVDVALPASLPAGQPFQVRVEPSDALGLDNVANAVWPESRRLRVRLASDQYVALLSALSQPGINVELVSSGAWETTDDVDLTVIDSTDRVSSAGAHGRFLVFGGMDPFQRTARGPIHHDLRPTQWQPESALLADVNLLSWRVGRTAGMVPGPSMVSIVESGDVPLVLALTERADANPDAKDLKVLYVNFDLRNSNLDSPSNLSFPVFVLNAIDYLCENLASPIVPARATGRPFLLPVHPTRRVVVHDPAGRVHPAYPVGDRIVITAPPRAGLYRVEVGQETDWLAFNWLPATITAKPRRRSAAGVESNESWRDAIPRSLWRALLIVAGLLMALEFVLFHRNVLRMN